MKSILKGVIAQESKEELNALKEKEEKQDKEPAELNDEELTQVSGGEFTLDIAGAKKEEDTQVFYTNKMVQQRRNGFWKKMSQEMFMQRVSNFV